MRGIRKISMVMAVATAGLMAGCQTSGTKKPTTVISPAPMVGDAADAEGVASEKTVGTAPASTLKFADRHPLFSKPKKYWDTSGDNKIVKAAAATFIGVPAGFVGEVKQIFVGVPAETRY